MERKAQPMRVKKSKPWSNYGSGVQVYDVCFEVDKLDCIKKTDGKDSEKYKSQHKKANGLIRQFNAEGNGSLNLSSCRAIVQRKAEFLGDRTTFFDKTPARKDKTEKKDGK